MQDVKKRRKIDQSQRFQGDGNQSKEDESEQNNANGLIIRIFQYETSNNSSMEQKYHFNKGQQLKNKQMNHKLFHGSQQREQLKLNQKQATPFIDTQNQQKMQSKFITTKNQSQLIQARIRSNKLKIKSLKLKDVSHHISKVIRRNKTYLCNFIHFLIPYLIFVLESYSLSNDQDTDQMQIFFYVLKKLLNPQISRQLNNMQEFEAYLKFLVDYKKVEHPDAILHLRKFLVIQGETMKAVCPYYYNLFAFVVNKEIVFDGDRSQTLVQYTVDFKHKYLNENFQNRDVIAQIEQLEKKLIDKYHNEDIA